MYHNEQRTMQYKAEWREREREIDRLMERDRQTDWRAEEDKDTQRPGENSSLCSVTMEEG